MSFDGTGYGDDGTIWGGEIFVGSLQQGFKRVAHLRQATLPGGDAAAEFPVQAAAGFLAQLDDVPDLPCLPLAFPGATGTLWNWSARTFALSPPPPWDGFSIPPLRFWASLERSLSKARPRCGWNNSPAARPQAKPYPFPFTGGELDFRPLLRRRSRRSPSRPRCQGNRTILPAGNRSGFVGCRERDRL